MFNPARAVVRRLCRWANEPASSPTVREDEKLYLRGSDTEQAVRAWFQEEVKQGATRKYDLGKFLLGISLTAMTLQTAVANLYRQEGLTNWGVYATAMGLGFVSAGLAVRMVL